MLLNITNWMSTQLLWWIQLKHKMDDHIQDVDRALSEMWRTYTVGVPDNNYIL